MIGNDMKKVAVVIGHNSKSQGAVRRDTGESEYKFNGRIADMMLANAELYPDVSFRVFRRKSGGGYSAEIDRVYAEVNKWSPNLSMELHFNANASDKANGCEMLSSGSTKSAAFAKAVNASVVEAIGVSNRGVKIRGKSDRGGRSLFAGRAPAILTEPFFGSSQTDLIATSGKAKEYALAKAYVAGCIAALGIPQATTTHKPTPKPPAPPLAVYSLQSRHSSQHGRARHETNPRVAQSMALAIRAINGVCGGNANGMAEYPRRYESEYPRRMGVLLHNGAIGVRCSWPLGGSAKCLTQ